MHHASSPQATAWSSSPLKVTLFSFSIEIIMYFDQHAILFFSQSSIWLRKQAQLLWKNGPNDTSTHIKLLNKHNGRCLKKFVSFWKGQPISLLHVNPPALQATSELPKRNIMASRISFVTKGGTDWDKSALI